MIYWPSSSSFWLGRGESWIRNLTVTCTGYIIFKLNKWKFDSCWHSALKEDCRLGVSDWVIFFKEMRYFQVEISTVLPIAYFWNHQNYPNQVPIFDSHIGDHDFPFFPIGLFSDKLESGLLSAEYLDSYHECQCHSLMSSISLSMKFATEDIFHKSIVPDYMIWPRNCNCFSF